MANKSTNTNIIDTKANRKAKSSIYIDITDANGVADLDTGTDIAAKTQKEEWMIQKQKP